MHHDVIILPAIYYQVNSYFLTDRRGNAALIGITLFNLVIMYPCVKLYYVQRNKQRAKVWDAMTPQVSCILNEII